MGTCRVEKFATLRKKEEEGAVGLLVGGGGREGGEPKRVVEVWGFWVVLLVCDSASGMPCSFGQVLPSEPTSVNHPLPSPNPIHTSTSSSPVASHSPGPSQAPRSLAPLHQTHHHLHPPQPPPTPRSSPPQRSHYTASKSTYAADTSAPCPHCQSQSRHRPCA